MSCLIIPRAMKERLLTLLVDLLLDCFSLLARPDKSPGIAVSTIPELAAALRREDFGITYPCPPENEQRGLPRAIPTPASLYGSLAVCVSADGPLLLRVETDARSDRCASPPVPNHRHHPLGTQDLRLGSRVFQEEGR